MVNRVLLY